MRQKKIGSVLLDRRPNTLGGNLKMFRKQNQNNFELFFFVAILVFLSKNVETTSFTAFKKVLVEESSFSVGLLKTNNGFL